GCELRRLLERLHERAEIALDRVQAALLLGRLEERLRVDALRRRHPYARPRSRTEKSRLSIASSISRRWSAESSTLPTTRSVASIVRSATSLRICSIARAVSASICLRVSSSRRCRSASASSRTRASCASATLRASARISADSDFACPISARCCSSSSRASARALSASAIAFSIRSRRSSITLWIGPNAYLRSTKNVTPKAISVQIIRPGTTLIRPDAATIPIELDEHVAEQAADEAVEDDGLGQREAQPLDPLQLAAQLGLARDRLDHRAEDDADAGAERAEADAERERDRLAGVGDVAGDGGDERECGHVSVFLLSARAR